jgi:hypothetical protein
MMGHVSICPTEPTDNSLLWPVEEQHRPSCQTARAEQFTSEVE